MKCPNCGEDMDFEEAKNFHGFWYCEDCDIEIAGSRIPCEAEYLTESASPVICDWEERIDT